MSKVFGYPKFDERGEMVLTTYDGDYAAMQMDVRVYQMKAGERRSFCRPGLRGDSNLHPAGGVDAPGALGEDVPAAGLGPLGLPGITHPAAKQQHRDLLTGAAEAAGFPRLHLADPHVHQHGGVVPVVSGKDHFAAFVKLGISKYLAHGDTPFRHFKSGRKPRQCRGRSGGLYFTNTSPHGPG